MSEFLKMAQPVPASKPILFVDPASLGYSIQGVSLLKEFVSATKSALFVETDKRLVPLFRRSFESEKIAFFATDPARRNALPDDGKPQTASGMEFYFESNADLIAQNNDLQDYFWSTLLRPEIASPFNAFVPPQNLIPEPDMDYLIPDVRDFDRWMSAYGRGKKIPILISWNKTFSQHGEVSQQNLDADDVSFIMRELAIASDLQLEFFNAVHGVSTDDLKLVNDKLPADIQLRSIRDPLSFGDFNLGTEIDRYASFMSVAKDLGGVMLGVGNTYQHLWTASAPQFPGDFPNQIVVLPHGDFSTKATWELQSGTAGSKTLTVSKDADFHQDREPSLRRVVESALEALSP